jgi:hypothetical protein
MQVLLRAGHDATFREPPYAPLPYCRVSQFLAASFARNRRFRDFLKFGTFGGCASGERAVLRVLSEYSLPLTFTLNGRPSGPACCFVFGYRLGTEVPPWGPPPHPGPTVRSDGWTALLWAAYHSNRRIVRALVASGADVNAQDRGGCAVCACGESAECGGRVAAAVCRAGTRRCTWPRPKAILNPSQSCCCAAPTGPPRPTTGNAALRRTAEPKPHQPRARRDTPKQVAEQYGKLAEYEAGESQVHPARRLTARAHCAPHP